MAARRWARSAASAAPSRSPPTPSAHSPPAWPSTPSAATRFPSSATPPPASAPPCSSFWHARPAAPDRPATTTRPPRTEPSPRRLALRPLPQTVLGQGLLQRNAWSPMGSRLRRGPHHRLALAFYGERLGGRGHPAPSPRLNRLPPSLNSEGGPGGVT